MAVVVKTDPSNEVFSLPTDEVVRARSGVLHDQGFNCAETMVRVFAEFGIVELPDCPALDCADTCLRKGVGTGRGSCGALVGGSAVINAFFGRRLDQRRWVYKLAGQFAQLFHERFSHFACRNARVSSEADCRALTCEATVLLNQFLSRRLPQ